MAIVRIPPVCSRTILDRIERKNVSNQLTPGVDAAPAQALEDNGCMEEAEVVEYDCVTASVAPAACMHTVLAHVSIKRWESQELPHCTPMGTVIYGSDQP